MISPSIYRSRRGITLVELLVVIAILISLVAVAVPVLRGTLEGQRGREAARIVNFALSAARNRAIETGRPAGIILYRDPSSPNVCVKLQQAESPPPYAGDFANSRIKLVSNVYTLDPAGQDASWAANVNNGDLLQFNYQGKLYRINISNPANKTNFTLTDPETGGGVTIDPAVLQNGLPFQVFRQPVPSLVPPVILPARTAIDMVFSGTADAPSAGGTLNASIVFSPNGAVAAVDNVPCVNRIYLLAGRRDRVPLGASVLSPAEDGYSNIDDPSNFWVVINPQTGMIATTEVAAVDTTLPNNDVKLKQSRRYAREAQRTGG